MRLTILQRKIIQTLSDLVRVYYIHLSVIKFRQIRNSLYIAHTHTGPDLITMGLISTNNSANDTREKVNNNVEDVSVGTCIISAVGKQRESLCNVVSVTVTFFFVNCNDNVVIFSDFSNCNSQKVKRFIELH